MTKEDLANYGTGGYYGNTYDQERYTAERTGPRDNNRRGYRDSYRHLGDRRWSDEPMTSWERERPLRDGYRPLKERIEIQESHRGKGPRSYRRRDERILEDVNERLYDDPFVNASAIETAVKNGEIILSGTVDDRQSKRRAEDIAESVGGVTNVENRLRIVPAP